MADFLAKKGTELPQLKQPISLKSANQLRNEQLDDRILAE